MNLDRIHKMNKEAQARHDEDEAVRRAQEREKIDKAWNRGFAAGYKLAKAEWRARDLAVAEQEGR